MTRLCTALATIGLLLYASGQASAQNVTASGYGAFGSVVFSASETFNAVAGSATKTGFGVGGTVSHLWQSVFVDVSFWQHKLDGERVFVDNGTVYPLGIPLEVTFRPFDLVGGWRFGAMAVEPYVGAGVSLVSYKETSDFSATGDDVNERKTGMVVLLGIDVPLSSIIRVGGEFRYRSVTGILGDSGVSQAFGEDNLGGAAFAVRVSIGQ